MDSTAVSIFNQLLGQYNGSIASIQSASIEIAKELFNAVALVSVAVLGINRLLSKSVDMAAVNIELIRLLIYLNVFYLFITQYDRFLPLIFNSFRAAGIYMGSRTAGYTLSTNPGSIINVAVNIASKILNIANKHTSLANIGLSLIAVGAAAVVLYCFGVIAIELILIDIGSRIILAGGIFLLAFAGSPWTREYAEHYVHAFFHLGLKMLFLYILVGIGAGLTSHWSQILDNVPVGQIIEYYIAVIMASFVYYKICQKLPDQAVVYFSGRLSMTYDPVGTIHQAITKSHEAFTAANKGLAAAVAGVGDMAAGIQGHQKAMSAARQAAMAQFTAAGKTPSAAELQKETVRTLGEARRQMRQAQWDKSVDATDDGKVAKSILADLPKDVDYTI